MMSMVNYVVKMIENFDQIQKKLNHKLYGIWNDDVFYFHMEVKGIKMKRFSFQVRKINLKYFASLQHQITRVPYLPIEIVRTTTPTVPKGKKVNLQ